MTTILQIDSSARRGDSVHHAHGSHTRRLTARFAAAWRAVEPAARIITRDLARQLPTPVCERWIHAAFTPPPARAAWMIDVLAESDALIDELAAADIIVIGAPMYNFGPPAPLKAYIDNIVRVGRTFGFDRARPVPYWPLLGDRPLVLLSSRGDHGYAAALAASNHVEPALRTAFAYIGITQAHEIAIEFDEFADHRLAASITAAEHAVDHLVHALSGAPASGSHAATVGGGAGSR